MSCVIFFHYFYVFLYFCHCFLLLHSHTTSYIYCCVISIIVIHTYKILLFYVAIIIQQDATIYSLFISVKCSTGFRWYLHPSSGAHITVSTVPDINETLTATCYERDRMGTGLGVTGLGDT